MAYIESGNATQSYMEAYGVATLVGEANGSRLLCNAKVKAALIVAKIATGKRLEKKFSISRDALLRILAEQAKFDPSQIIEIGEHGVTLKKPKNMKAIKSFSYSKSDSAEGGSESFSFSVHDKIKAVEVLAKMTGALDADPGEERRDTSVLHGRAAELARRRKPK